MKRCYGESLIGWKKINSPGRAFAAQRDGYAQGDCYIVKLEIEPWRAVRWNDGPSGKITKADEVNVERAKAYKLRAAGAIVLEVQHVKASRGKPKIPVGISMWDKQFAYTERATVVPTKWDDSAVNACGGGIHFYLTRKQAVEH